MEDDNIFSDEISAVLKVLTEDDNIYSDRTRAMLKASLDGKIFHQ